MRSSVSRPIGAGLVVTISRKELGQLNPETAGELHHRVERGCHLTALDAAHHRKVKIHRMCESLLRHPAPGPHASH